MREFSFSTLEDLKLIIHNIFVRVKSIQEEIMGIFGGKYVESFSSVYAELSLAPPRKLSFSWYEKIKMGVFIM